ncbi:hypothetical protein KQX63_00560 [Rhodopseudomonas palustris]|nr:hypothetical protein [Rhodopseudomonas sp. BR0C11]NEW98210.1 hypothetical protein [Rhodopseudomonas sp. BR0G17]UYO44560.1 hypothetical protein KQX63_00560 [Rhodopseudomonas palustris]
MLPFRWQRSRQRSSALSFLKKAFYQIPVIGWLVKDAAHGSPEAPYFFLFNAVVVGAALIYTFGYPLVITVAVAGAFAGIAGLVVLTAGDAFDKRAKQPATDVRRAKTATVRPLKKAA